VLLFSKFVTKLGKIQKEIPIMFTFKGKTALITGASSGLGLTFAHALAERGMNIILVARSAERLRALAKEISEQHTVHAEVLVADLSQAREAERIQQAVEQRELTVDLLINNAGFATHGFFETLEPEREQEEIMVDVASVVALTHAFLPPMVARGEGAVINVASTAAFQPVPYMAVYGASKAFVLSFSQALSEEYRKRGIRFLALCPGATETNFFQVVDEGAAVGRRRTSEQVIATALQALEQGRTVVIDGQANAFTALTVRFVPRRLVTRIGGQMFRPRDTKTKTRVNASL